MWFKNLWPHIYIWSGIYKLHVCIPYATKGGIGVCLYTGRQTLHSLQCCVNWIVTGARILGIQISRESSYMTGVHRYYVSSASGAQKFGKKNMKRTMAYQRSMTLYPYMHSRLPLGTLSCSPPWNKDIRVLQLFLFATVSLIQPKRTNTFR